MAKYGKTTRVRLLGGELIYVAQGDDPPTMVRHLQGIKRRALDLRVPFAAFRPKWFAQNVRVFAAEGLPQPWPALSPAYAAWKAANFPGKTIMRRTDRLYSSLTAMTPETLFEVGPRTIRFGTAVPYEAYHRGRRDTVVLLPETFDELNAMVMNYIIPEHGEPD